MKSERQPIPLHFKRSFTGKTSLWNIRAPDGPNPSSAPAAEIWLRTTVLSNISMTDPLPRAEELGEKGMRPKNIRETGLMPCNESVGKDTVFSQTWIDRV